MVKNRTWNLLVSIFLMVPLLFALMVPVCAAEGEDGESFEPSLLSEGEFPDPEDVDLRMEYGDLLSPEQFTALEEAYAQLKTSVLAAEKIYQDAIKDLKERYRKTAQDAVKSINDEIELVEVLDQLKAEILSAYEEVQETLDSDVESSRLAFREAADAAVIPAEITDTLIGWHENKEINTANELINFIESYKNLSGPGKNGQTQGQGNGNTQQNLVRNNEQNQEENQNQGGQQNQEQEKQKEQNDGNSHNPGNQSWQQDAQSQSSQQGAKGKGGH